MLAGKTEDAKPLRKFYTGAALVSLVGVNLSAEEMAAVGIIKPEQVEKAKEKTVKYRDDEKKQYRLDFWFKVQERVEKDTFVKVSIDVWPEDVATSGAGNLQVMNTCNRTNWISPDQFAKQEDIYAKDATTPWFTKPYRRAQKGEEKLYELLKLVAGKKAAEPLGVKILLNEVIEGNYKTIGAAIASNEGRRNSFIKLLLGVQVSSEGNAYQIAFRKPMHQYSKEDTYKKIHAEVVDYLAHAKSTYYFGFGSEEFNAAKFLFRPLSDEAFLAVQEAALSDGQMQSQQSSSSESKESIDEALAAISGESQEPALQLDTTGSKGGDTDDELPF